MNFLGWFRTNRTARTAPLGLGSAPRLADIHANAFTRPWGTEEFERFLSERNILSDGLFIGPRQEPTGFILSRKGGDEAEILSIAIAPEARGRGHAGMLLDRHLQTLTQAGVRKVFLEAEEGNRPALKLYRRRGFREVGRRAGYYARPDGSRATQAMSAAGLAS